MGERRGEERRGEAYTRFWCQSLRKTRTTWDTQTRWEDNIKMDFQEAGCGGMDWIELAQDRDRNL
jgi:hypothetical protein